MAWVLSVKTTRGNALDRTTSGEVGQGNRTRCTSVSGLIWNPKKFTKKVSLLCLKIAKVFVSMLVNLSCLITDQLIFLQQSAKSK